jgi:plasmid maintenance system killer protein
LKKRNLEKHFIKAKNNILNGNISWWTQFWRKEPKDEWIWYFRLNKQYRALCYFDEKDFLFITEIDNHQ